MKYYDQSHHEKVMLELVQVGRWYRESEVQSARSHYDLYARILIQNDEDADKESMFRYWESLKRGNLEEITKE